MTQRMKLVLSGLFFIVVLTLIYLNHFDNGFYFDDTHTITNNEAITSLDNLSSFFLDANTFSSLPANRAYRPMVTTLNAISFQLGNGLVPEWFHIHMFFWYLVLLVVLYFSVRYLLYSVFNSPSNDYLALAAVVFYGFHTANAETINYLISISDAFSTLCIVLTLLFYQVENLRKKYIYLIPLVIGLYTKQTALMVVPILVLYELIFIQNLSDTTDSKGLLSRVTTTIKNTYPAIVVGVGLFLTNQLLFTPDSTVSLNKAASKFEYFYTQFYIVTHYLWNFVLPTKLSADPDFMIFSNFFNRYVLFGLLIILIMLAVATFSLRRRETALIGFGIFWFFLGLLPTSSFVPLYQIANDHRTFFPYIGLVISMAGLAGLIYHKYSTYFTQKTIVIISGLFLLVVGGYAYGTYQRNEVWNSSESLWYDVTVKSPKNGRGLMNYGLTQMSAGKYEKALEYYNRALRLLPYYSYLHINLAIIKNSMGEGHESEQYFKNALTFDRNNPEAYYYYANWLNQRGRQQEALDLLKQGVQLGPNHTRMNQLYRQLSGLDNLVQENKGQTMVSFPEGMTANQYINLSLQFYKDGQYEACVRACEEALKIEPNSAIAYNNICSAYNKLKRWDKALVACKRAVAIDPNFQRAKNNLKWARDEYHKQRGN